MRATEGLSALNLNAAGEFFSRRKSWSDLRHGIQLSKSWMIGDKDIDVQCGRAACCRTILVRTGHGGNQTGSEADFTVGNVVEAIEIAVRISQNPTSDILVICSSSS